MSGKKYSVRKSRSLKAKTSRSASAALTLSKPKNGEVIRLPTLQYFRSRNRRKLHALVLGEFEKSGITQAELCRRLDKEAAQVSRMLGTPGNWGVDTVSDILYALSGAEPSYQIVRPFERPAKNFRSPEWVTAKPENARGTSDVVDIQLADEKPGFRILKERALVSQ